MAKISVGDYTGIDMNLKSDAIQHYGRLGMKWYQNIFTKPGTAKKRPKNSSDDDDSKKKKTPASRAAQVKSLSDDELRAFNNRVQLERKYLELTAPKKSAGKKFIESVFADASKQVATKYTAKYMGVLVESIEEYIKSGNMEPVKKKK